MTASTVVVIYHRTSPGDTLNYANIPAAGSIYTGSSRVAELAHIDDPRPMYLEVETSQDGVPNLRRSALVKTITANWTRDRNPQDVVTVKFVDESVEDLILEDGDQVLTYHLSDIARPDLDIQSTANFFGRGLR